MFSFNHATRAICRCACATVFAVAPVLALANEMADDCPAIKSPDGSDFDWGLVSDDADVKRCLLDLAQNLVAVEAMANWMRTQRFEVTDPYVVTPGKIHLYAIWDTPKRKENIPFWENIPFLEK